MADEMMAVPASIVRGLEIVRFNRVTTQWEVVGKFKPTELAARQAAMDVKWMRERHPAEHYDLRVLVSLARQDKPETPTTEPARRTPTEPQEAPNG